MYAINLETFNVKECAELESGYAEISEEVFFELKNALQDETNPNISENGIDKFKAILGKALSGEQTWKIDSQTGNAQFKNITINGLSNLSRTVFDVNYDVEILPTVGFAGVVPGCPTKFGIKLGWNGGYIRYIVNNNSNVAKQLANLVTEEPYLISYQAMAIPNGTYSWHMFSTGAYDYFGKSYRFYIIQPTVATTNLSAGNNTPTNFKYPNGVYILSGGIRPINGSCASNLDTGTGGKNAYIQFPTNPEKSSTPILMTVASGGNTLSYGGSGFMFGQDEVVSYIGNKYRFFYAFDGRISNIYKINTEDIDAINNAIANYLETTEENYEQNQINIKTGCKFTYVPNDNNELMLTEIPNYYSYWNIKINSWEINVEEKIYHIQYELNNMINKYAKYTIPFYFSRFTKLEQDALLLFLNECDKLLKNVTVDTVIPEIPDFLKGL